MLWIKIVAEFFEIPQMVSIEKRKALRIENFFCNIRRIKVKQKLLKLIYIHRGYNLKMTELPLGITLTIMSYLSKKELLQKAIRINRRHSTIIKNPCLWREISIFASKESRPYQFRD